MIINHIEESSCPKKVQHLQEQYILYELYTYYLLLYNAFNHIEDHIGVNQEVDDHLNVP